MSEYIIDVNKTIKTMVANTRMHLEVIKELREVLKDAQPYVAENKDLFFDSEKLNNKITEILDRTEVR